jgi:nicotinamidase-related amidase
MTTITKTAILRRHKKLPELRITRENTALLIIDMQYEDAHPDYGLCARFKTRGEQEAVKYYTDHLATIVPNTQRLLAAFRDRGMEVIYTRIESLTKDGRDRSLEHKSLGIHSFPGSKEAQVLEEIAPRADEIVLSKTCGSVFNGTMIDYILRNIGIQNLVVVGVVLSGCVEVTVRDAADRSYGVIVVEDACATWTEEMHGASIWAMDEIYGKAKTTDEVLQILAQVK